MSTTSWAGADRDIYVPMEALRSDLEASPALSGIGLLEGAALRPTAVLARQVATPNYELMWFTRVARRHGFRPLVIEHTSDIFTVHNSAKRSLVTLPLVTGRSRNGHLITRRQKVADLAASEGQRLEEIRTLTGETLVAYHHRKLVEVLGPEAPEVMDLRDLLPSVPLTPSRYYVEFFRMLQGDLVLFEDFVVDEQTATFFRRTVHPAWEHVVVTTGRRPKIAKLSPERVASSPMWNAYPGAMADDPNWMGRSGAARGPALLMI